jgi:hypothetical protein
MSFRHFPSSAQARSRTRIPRALVVVLLALQGLVWGGGSIIEAKAAAESLTRYSHVEDQGTTACPPIHSHLDCLICRTLTGGTQGGSSPAIVASAYLRSASPGSDAVVPAACGLPGMLGSRGPPPG